MRWVISIALVVVAWFFGAWIFMVGVGVVHAEWLHSLPTISYDTAFLLAMLTGVLVGGRAVLGSVVQAILGRNK